MPASSATELPLRIIVEQPLPGVALALQVGKDQLVPPSAKSADEVRFDFTVRLGTPQADGSPNFLGPCTQGPAASRFVYLCVGRRAGQASSCWDGRIKVPLGGISQAQVKSLLASPGKRLAVRFPGQRPDGRPTLATVRLAANAWRVVED